MSDASLNVAGWQVLVALADGGGFLEASLHTGIELSACSRLISRLEESLDIRLIVHHSRPARLTARAESILPAARAFVESYDRLMLSSRASAGLPMVLSFSIPVNIQCEFVPSALREYRKVDPGLSLVISSDCDHDDVLSGRVTAAYLPYRPEAGGLILWRVGEGINCMVASPAYIARRGMPRTPADLAGHDLILRQARNYPVTTALTDGASTVPLNCRDVVFRGDVPSGRQALLAGEGIAVDLSFEWCEEELEAGRLVPVLPGWHRPPWQLTVATVRGSAGNPRITRFCRWFAVQAAKANDRRMKNLESFLGRHRTAAAGTGS